MSLTNELPTSSTPGTCLWDIPLLPFDTSVMPHRDHITSSDHVPLEIVQSIRACMEEQDLKVSQLDKLLGTIEKARKLVISRRAEHASLANAYRGALSLLRNFPAELLEQIFFHCVEFVHNTLSPNNPPWVFGKVCHRWRSVALSSPRLWSVIPALNSGTEFYTPFGAPNQITMGTKSNFYVELLSTSLRLSRTLPLDLDFSVHSGDVNGHPMLDVISPHLHRCQSLAVATHAVYLHLLNQAFQDKSPSLCCLTISVIGSTTELVMCDSLSSFQHLSNIRVLGINIYPDDNMIDMGMIRALNTGPFISSWLKIIWSNLTTFSGYGLQMQHVTDLLHNAPSLIKCSFADLLPLNNNSHFTMVKHTSLCSFDVSVWPDFESPAVLLDFLMLPFLVELSISVDNDWITVNSLVSFFLRSSCSLSTLMMRGEGYNSGNMGTILTSLKSSSLINLKLNFVYGIELNLVHLEPLMEQPLDSMLPILPHLQHITAELGYPSDDGPESFKDLSNKINQLIESRLYMSKSLGTKALETVTLTRERGLSTELFNELEGWSESPSKQSQVTYTKLNHWFSVFKKMYWKSYHSSTQVNKEVNHPLI